MNIISPILTDTLAISAGGTVARSRFIETVANLRVNGYLFDFQFELSANNVGKITSWEFLKAFNVNIALRLGSGNGSAVNTVQNVNAYQLLELSDFDAGVSPASTDFSTAGVKRISGVIDAGYFGMGSRDALECNINVDVSKLPAGIVDAVDVKFTVSATFERIKPTTIFTYQSCKPTGADQPYTNVLRVFYDSPTVMNASASIKDKITGQQSVNLEDAIAYSNANGNFEFFQRFGQIYRDQYDLSRDISFSVPKTPNDDGELLVVGLAFYPEMLVENSSEDASQRQAIIDYIKNNDAEKYKYLQLRGVV